MCIRMLFGILIFVLSLILTNTSAIAENSIYSDVTTNQKIINTLNVLKNHDTESRHVLNVILGDNLSKKPIKIMFYDLSTMGSDFESMDAVACKKKNSDSIYILINQIHESAPTEALASLLAHETIHQDDNSSIQEEITGWTNEAKAWMSYKATNSKLNNIDSDNCPLVQRLNTIEEMYSASSSNIARKVTSISGYAVLPQYSPGYGI